MRPLYEINKALRDAVDSETGEISISEEELDALFAEKEQKVINIACFIKNLTAMSEALKAEEEVLKPRRKVKENCIARLKDMLLTAVTPGTKFESPQVAISWRKSEVVEINEAEFLKFNGSNSEYVKTKVEVSPDKVAIKDALKKGLFLKGAELKQNNNIQIK